MVMKCCGPWVFTLLDGLALETVEHLTLEQLTAEDGDEVLWKLLEERFPDKLKHDHLAECLKEVFGLYVKDNETMAEWTSRVQETFSKCCRKVSVDFPPEARGLSPDQRAIVMAKTGGDLKFETVVSSMRSCFPDYVASKSKKTSAALVIDQQGFIAEDESYGDHGDSVVFDEVEAFLSEYGVHADELTGEFDEAESAEILAANWKEKRSEIARLQKSRNLRAVTKVQQQFRDDLSEVKKRTRCRRCNKVGHWARECPMPKGKGKGATSAASDRSTTASGAALVETQPTSEAMMVSEVLLVSSPGFGIIDSGCGKTLIGQTTLNELFRMYQQRGVPLPKLRSQQNVFAFGNNHEEVSKCVVDLTVGINGRLGHVEAAVIQGPAPLLLSRTTMRSLGATLDFGHGTLSLHGSPAQTLEVNSAGQFLINILDFPVAEALTCDSSCTASSSSSHAVSDVQNHETLVGVTRSLTKREARCVETQTAAWDKSFSKCLVAELFSPPRFSAKAKEKGYHGLSFDIKQGWDLLKKDTQRQVSAKLDEAKPSLLVLCPECKHWGGWYRLNQHKLPLWVQVYNRQVAQKQADFCVEQAKRQLKRGGRVLIEHPWSSSLWKYPPMAKLLKQMHLCRASMCAYGLKCPDTGKPILKPTGLAVSHADMIGCALECPGHHSHKVIEGRCRDGSNLSSFAAAYTPCFVETWLSCVIPQDSSHLCLFASVQDPNPAVHALSPPGLIPSECLANEEVPVDQIRQSLKRLHNNLGHPDTTNMVRILRNAGASSRAIEEARKFSCEICIQRQRPTPCLPPSAHSIVDFNHRVGVDVKILPGWGINQKVKCLNIVDWASSYQVMIPFHETETGHVLKRLFQDKWQSWAGPPVELLMDPAKTNQSETFVSMLEDSGVRVLTTAAEAHNQLGKVEKHGHLFEVVLEKTLDQCQPQTKEEWEQCVIQTMNAKNSMLNQEGLSPNQHVFGRNPRLPDDLMQDSPDPVSGTAALHDSAFAKAQAIRTAARVSLVQSQDSKTLRTALNARPRAERDFLAGDFVCYWRTQKYQRGIRLVGGRWYGVAIVMGKVGSQYVDLSQQEMPPQPEEVPSAAASDDVAMPEVPTGPMHAAQASEARVPAESAHPVTEAAVEPNAEVSSGSVPLPNFALDESTGLMSVPSEPFPASASRVPSTPPDRSSSYGPLRFRHTSKKPEVMVRPPETMQSDFAEAVAEMSREKRASSRTPSAEPPSKMSRTETLPAVVKTVETIEVFLANFLKKKMQTELHHSNNPPEIQEAIDESKVLEWLTLQDEKQAIKVLSPHEAAKIRKNKPDRIMTSRFVITKKVEDGDTRMKSRWCLRGHHDPDLLEKVASGKCHSPTLAQLSKNVLLQLLVSFQWEMNLGDIKGAFLEANVQEQYAAKPVYSELPPGGVPGVEPGSLVQILGNIYGANDAPHNWYREFDMVAQQCGFTKSKFDSCLYWCFGETGKLEGCLGAHVDDTITGGKGPTYTKAIAALRERFPFRKWRTGHGEFLGVEYKQDPITKEITYHQKDYALNISPIKVSKERARKPWQLATAKEVAALRAVNGALGWLSSQSRPDLSVQTSLSQQCFPNPTVEHLLLANQAVRRARQHSDLEIKVAFIDPAELTVCFWSDAAFANAADHKTQGGWLMALTSKQFADGTDCPVSFVGWKSYRLPRVVSSTLAGEAQCFSSASGIAEWCMLILSEALDGPFSLDTVDDILQQRSPIGMSDCRSLYDHLVTLGSGGTLDDKRVAIDIAVIRQSIVRSRLQPRWTPTDRMVADGLTKDKGEPLDLLRSVFRNARYQLADEQLVLERKRKNASDVKNLVGIVRMPTCPHIQSAKMSPSK
eukprot:s413_g16.t1